MKGTLYLIPSLLGDTPAARAIPPENTERLSTIRHFIVEEVRTARRFLRACIPDFPIDASSFLVYNEHTAGEDLSFYLEPLEKGSDAGLLSEAGIPCVADPGAAIVRAAHERGIRVRPLPGPSSLLLALAASGFNGQHFLFHGYLPVDRDGRTRKIRELEKAIYALDQTQIFIETPYRNQALFRSLLSACRDGTRLCIAEGLTTDEESVRVNSIAAWKRGDPGPGRRPAVFLLYR